MQEIDFARVALALAFFAYASVSDWRTRKVRNLTWIALGSIAFVIFEADLLQRNASLLDQSLLLPLIFVFFDIFWEKGEGAKGVVKIAGPVLYVASFVWIIFAGATSYGSDGWKPEMSAPVIAFAMILIFELLYMFDVIKGGADAKAIICLSLLFPLYPNLANGIPLIAPSSAAVLDFFTFALSVLFVGALISLILPIYFLAKNVRAGKKISGRSFVGFALPIDQVEGHFVWLMEWVENGQLRFSSRKLRESEKVKEDLAALRDFGSKEVWVTYKIPFIIPMTVGIVIVLLVGNPLFVLY